MQTLKLFVFIIVIMLQVVHIVFSSMDFQTIFCMEYKEYYKQSFLFFYLSNLSTVRSAKYFQQENTFL